MKTGWKIFMAVVITFFATLYGVYFLQSKNLTFDFSNSKAYNRDRENFEDEPERNYSFYDDWLCTIGVGMCAESPAEPTGPHRR